MSAPIFHVGIASDPICADWPAIDKALEYLTRNRRALGDTIMLHDITPWGSTKMALLWGTANYHPVLFTEDELHLRLNSAIAIFDDLHEHQLLNALVVFHNPTSPAHNNISALRAQIGITARDINREMDDLIAYAQKSSIPTRVVPYDSASDTNKTGYPLRVLQHGQNDRHGANLRSGSFYAPCATRNTAQDWLFHAIANCYTDLIVPGAYTLDTLHQTPNGWWNYSMHFNHAN